MTITHELRQAFRYHLARAPHWTAQGYSVPTYRGIDYSRPDYGMGRAAYAIRAARAEALPLRRWPAPIKGYAMRAGHDADKPGSVYVADPESFGLRLVGRVIADCGGRNGIWDSRGVTGWYDNPHGESYRDGSGLIYGLVYQLPARRGASRFVAAYQNGCNDSGALIDFGTIYESEPGGTWGSAQDDDAARDAARAADSMAKSVAEAEREYKTAWQAGSLWNDCQTRASDARAAMLEILRERRAAMASPAFTDSKFFALCDAIRARVSDLLQELRDAREQARELAQGDHGDLIFYPGDSDMRAAFNEGAGETVI